MSYPSGNPGYPPASQQSPQYAGAQQFHTPQEPIPAGPSKLPQYLSIAVVVLGLAAYLARYAPLFSDSAGEYFTPTLLEIGIVASVAGALLAGTGLLPKQKDPIAIVAVLAVIGFLAALLIVISVPKEVSIGWGLYLILAFSLLQTIVAVWVLLLDAGIVSAPVPKPKYEQPQQYNPYGGGPAPYYGQQMQQPLQQAPMQQPQRPSYPPQYGGYPAGQSTTAFTTGNGGNGPAPQSGPPTPPTGFPAYGQPQSAGPATSVIPQQTPPPQPAEQDSAPPPS